MHYRLHTFNNIYITILIYIYIVSIYIISNIFANV